MSSGAAGSRPVLFFASFVAVVWAAFVSAPNFLDSSSPLDALESVLVDLRYSTIGPSEPPSRVAVVAIDDSTLSATGGSYPLDRDRLAEIVEAVAAAGPRALALDIVLADKGEDGRNLALVAALRRVPAVIAAAGRVASDELRAELPETSQELWPHEPFLKAANTGLVNIETDLSGTPRNVPMLYLTSRGIQPSMPLQLASLYLGVKPEFSGSSVVLDGRSVPLDVASHLPLRLLGPSGTVPTIPAQDVLSGNAGARISGKAVVIGITAIAVGDTFATPFDEATPGAEIVASATAQLLGESALRRDRQTRLIDVVAGFVLAAGATWLALALPLSTGLPLVLVLLGGWLATIWFAFVHGIWLSAAQPLVSAMPPLAVAAGIRYTQERRRARVADRAAAALGQFQSPVLASMIAANPDFLREPESRHLEIFFIDLTGFTRLSQALGPAKTNEFLKRFHTWVTQAVEERDGMIFNFMGDGAMAVFGLTQRLPETPPNSDGIAPSAPTAADNALATAFSLMADLPSLRPPGSFADPLGFRIGLHGGPVILSRLGHEHHQQLSVSGDPVNLCSRLLEIAKAEGARIAATAEFIAALGREPELPPNSRKRVGVRGREGPVEVALWNG